MFSFISFHLSGVWSWWQQAKWGISDVPSPQQHFPPPSRRPRGFPVENKGSKEASYSDIWNSSVGYFQFDPALALVRALSDDWAPHSMSEAEPSQPMEESHFQHLYLCFHSCSLFRRPNKTLSISGHLISTPCALPQTKCCSPPGAPQTFLPTVQQVSASPPKWT